MPRERPTLTQLRNMAMADIAGGTLTTIDGFLRRANLPVLSWAIANQVFGLDDFLDWIALQSVPFTSTGEFLRAWAALIGVTPKPATAASFQVTFAAANGILLSAATSIARSDGALFTVTIGATSALASVTVTVTANVPGSAGDTQAGATMVIQTPIVGISSSGTAGSSVTIGADPETDDSLRSRMLAAYAAPPRGGDASDYVEWCLAVPGVTRAWVLPNGMGAGTVLVWTMLDLAESVFSGFPQGTNGVATNEPRDVAATGDQLAVANALFPSQPVTVLVYSSAPVSQALNFSITGLGVNNTSAMQATISAALADLLLRLGNVGGSVNPVTRVPFPAIEPSEIYGALAAIPGLANFTVGSPSAPVTPASGHLFVIGSISYAT